MMNFKAEKGEWFVNTDLSKPLSFGDDEAFLAKDKNKLEDEKSPIMQMLEEIIARLKEQTQKVLERQRENAKKIEKVDIKA